MSDRQNSLKPIDARTPYSPFTRPLRGAVNYRWNVLNAALVESQRDNSGVFPEQAFTPGLPVCMALFTQDVPVYLVGESSYTGGFYPAPAGAAIPPLTMVEPDVLLVDTFAEAGMAVVSPVRSGQVAQIRLPLATPAFTIPAYAALFSPIDRSIVDEGDTALPFTLRLSVVAESGVLAGTPTFDNVGAPGIVDTTPIFLPAVAYTQAIRENGNVIPSASGGPVYTVVGLYVVQSPRV